MIGKIIALFYLIFVMPVLVIIMAGLTYGGFVETIKYFKNDKSSVPK